MKITVAGTGYVGLSMVVLLAQYNEVTSSDIIKERVELVNNRNPQSLAMKLKTFFKIKS